MYQTARDKENLMRKTASKGDHLKELENYKMPKFDSLIDPKSFKQAFLKGTKEAVYYCKSYDPTYTHCMGHFKGKQVVPEEIAKIIDNFWTTCVAFAIPDPPLMSKYLSNF